jgi:hypothetical protein
MDLCPILLDREMDEFQSMKLSRKTERYAERARLIFLFPSLFAAAVQHRFEYSSSDMDALWSRVLRPSLGQKILDSKREEKRKSASLPTANDEVNNQ